MFDDKFFDDWLDSQVQKVMEKVASGEGIANWKKLKSLELLSNLDHALEDAV